MKHVRRNGRRNEVSCAGCQALGLAAAMVLPSTIFSCLATPGVGFMISPSNPVYSGCIQIQEGMAGSRRLHTPDKVRPLDDGYRRETHSKLYATRMLWSGGRRTRGNEVTVNIERTSLNSRRISGSIVVNRPIEDVWLILTDYDRLSEYVPNLTQSQTRPSDDGTIRLWQEGAQNIVGFDFRASLEMAMEEHFGDPEKKMSQRKLTFDLLDSAMFKEFDGEWRMQFNSRKAGKAGEDYQYATKLFYMVHIRPKGPVPVLALEWQISAEVPNNLSALKEAAENATPEYIEMRRRERQQKSEERQRQRMEGRGYSNSSSSSGTRGRNNIEGFRGGAEAFVKKGPDGDGSYVPVEWDTDETLEAYIAKG